MGNIVSRKPNGFDPVAEHPVIKQLIADVAAIRHALGNIEQAQVLINGLVTAMADQVNTVSEQNKTIIDQTNRILDYILQRGDERG